MKKAILIVCVVISLGSASSAMDVEWTRQLGASGDDNGWGVSVDSSGNAYVTGYTYGGFDGNTNAGSWDMFLTKYEVPEPATHPARLVRVLVFSRKGGLL